ncbi:hypothetical protein [Candidatus Avelusimicrobium alvi]|uniref:hypothetical protein n=1 Tax=Candidatus Avelusimicrobium alvi TaxID=3416221 RepID=UPI003D0E7321
MSEKTNFTTALWAVPLMAAILAGALTLGVYAWERLTHRAPVRPPSVSQTDEHRAAIPAEEYPDNSAASGVPSPRLRYNMAREKCTYNTHSACRKETLPGGESVEIIQFPTLALVLTRIDRIGGGYERLGFGPEDQIQYFSQKDRTWFFDGDGRVNQLTASAPGPDQADVIHFAPGGAQTDCRCADRTLNCCTNPAYDLTAKPNTYCTMFPQDTDVCGWYCGRFPAQCERVQ